LNRDRPASAAPAGAGRLQSMKRAAAASLQRLFRFLVARIPKIQQRQRFAFTPT
jgi:hypothetical protein